jgi:hypothetical protein
MWLNRKMPGGELRIERCVDLTTGSNEAQRGTGRKLNANVELVVTGAQQAEPVLAR